MVITYTLYISKPFNFSINCCLMYCLQESIHVPAPVISMSIKPVDKNSTDNFSKGNKCYDKKGLRNVIGIHICNQKRCIAQFSNISAYSHQCVLLYLAI